MVNTVKVALLMAVVVAGGLACGEGAGSNQTQQPSTSSSPSAEISPSAKAVAPSRPPVGASVTFVNAPVTAARGQNATLRVKTGANLACTIEVDYKSGPSTAAGLSPKTSDAAGNVSWTWKVGANTTTGNWPITVTCNGGSAQTFVKVT